MKKLLEMLDVTMEQLIIGGMPILALCVFIYSFGWIVGIASGMGFWVLIVVYLAATGYKFEEESTDEHE